VPLREIIYRLNATPGVEIDETNLSSKLQHKMNPI
jgi:hypothetical protein